MIIGIITFHASHNYGSMLQAWALQTYVQRLGHKVEIINFRTNKQRRIYPSPISLHLRGIKQFLLLLLFNPSALYPELIRWHKFEKFIKEELNITKEYHTNSELSKIGHRYDILICGSDQIWISCGDGDRAYFGNFLPVDVKKIAYAPSLGPYPFERIDRNYIQSNLKGFDALSVREDIGKSFLESLFQSSLSLSHAFKDKVSDQRINVVCDPTLLLSSQDYEGISAPEDCAPKGEYIFFYCLRPTPSLIKLANTVGEIYNLPVYTNRSFPPKKIKDYPMIQYWPAIGPKEFLTVIKKSVATCGDSFHLLVFSTIFHKKAYCLNDSTDSRILNLLKRMDLEEMAVETSLDIERCYKLSLDFDRIKDDLASYVNDSKRFLQENLKSE